jgi:hypothetical protein
LLAGAAGDRAGAVLRWDGQRLAAEPARLGDVVLLEVRAGQVEADQRRVHVVRQGPVKRQRVGRGALGVLEPAQPRVAAGPVEGELRLGEGEEPALPGRAAERGLRRGQRRGELACVTQARVGAGLERGQHRADDAGVAAGCVLALLQHRQGGLVVAVVGRDEALPHQHPRPHGPVAGRLGRGRRRAQCQGSPDARRRRGP